MSLLITGGAGYIGAHVVRQAQGVERCVVVDDLSTGDASRVGETPVVELDLTHADAADKLVRTMQEHEVDAVVHLAARKQVGESVQRPAYYYQQNIGGLANLLTAMEQADVTRFVFSSSAATYGNSSTEGLVREDDMCSPLSPYGETKLIGEWMCANAEKAWGLDWVALRYFNVAGAGSRDLGDPAVLNLVPLVLEAITQGRQPRVFGADYATNDGTCVRDYVHVQDLADAHVTALQSLRSPGDGRPRHHVYNIGTGQGSSVREVLDTVGRVTGLDVTGEIVPRRPGDPAVLVADVQRVRDDLSWKAHHSLEDMVTSAWEAWQSSHG
ncbi:MAG: galE [Nocardioides sp.]|jgi:UDP-glucose 4-epimerase|uniref:UDP-glucose 4-epimerase GalE n=1 Tax=Nocardioides sp. TaxID=35761 RepID=UPI002614FB32|nr:UDP-glucose 4-epimerase GalE [Nocardioides sp.]MCW2832733.1 galE [Nocardioides sp.]